MIENEIIKTVLSSCISKAVEMVFKSNEEATKTRINQFYIAVLLVLYGFIFPIDDAAELLDVGIPEFDKLLGCDFASSTASAVDENQLILVGKLLFSAVGNLVFGNHDCSRDMPLIVFLLRSRINDNISALAIHQCLGFCSADLLIGCRTAIRASDATKRQCER